MPRTRCTWMEASRDRAASAAAWGGVWLVVACVCEGGVGEGAGCR
jgi:hypothetical protein